MTLPDSTSPLWSNGAVVCVLAVATAVGVVLSRTLRSEHALTTVRNINARIKTWWTMQLVAIVVLFVGRTVSVALFALTSFLALREYVTATPTRPGDRRTLLWAFLVILPLQYYLVHVQWYGLFSVLIPVYAFLFVPIRTLATDDAERFLERTARIHWGLMLCIYCVSHAPALLLLEIRGWDGRRAVLLVFLFVVVEASDVAQYAFGRWFGRRRLLPNISPRTTGAGFVAGAVTGAVVGASLSPVTPFQPLEAAALALALAVMGFFGDLTTSAMSRARGVEEYGSAIEGYGGVMDRIAPICFAAPVYFHYVRYCFT